jgi:hypothetical protein
MHTRIAWSVVLCLLPAAAGCKVYDADVDMEGTKTLNRLHTLGLAVEACARKGVEFKVIESEIEFLSVAAKCECFEAEKELETDAWGRPFRWRVTSEGDITKVRILSDGRNGICEDGGGDDLYVEVTLVKNGVSTLRWRGLKRNGEKRLTR